MSNFLNPFRDFTAIASSVLALTVDVDDVIKALTAVALLLSILGHVGFMSKTKNLIVKTLISVAVFFVVIFASAYSPKSEALEFDPYIDGGFNFNYSYLRTGGIGARFDDSWDVQLRATGEGSTKRGYQERRYNYSASRVFKTHYMFLGGEFRPGIGIVASSGMQLVGPINYRLRLILNYVWVEFELAHDSSAKISKKNSGVDFFTFRLFL